MKSRAAKAPTLAAALTTYAERSLRELVRDHSGAALRSADSDHQRQLLEAIVALFPSAGFPLNFLCCLLRAAAHLKASTGCRAELEKRAAAALEEAAVEDLLVASLSYEGERVVDLESVRRIISGFVERERSVGVFNANGGDLGKEICSVSMQRVAKTVDAYLGEIATFQELTISKFNGIANLIPKFARKVDDDLYRAIDIYLKVPNSSVLFLFISPETLLNES